MLDRLEKLKAKAEQLRAMDKLVSLESLGKAAYDAFYDNHYDYWPHADERYRARWIAVADAILQAISSDHHALNVRIELLTGYALELHVALSGAEDQLTNEFSGSLREDRVCDEEEQERRLSALAAITEISIDELRAVAEKIWRAS